MIDDEVWQLKLKFWKPFQWWPFWRAASSKGVFNMQHDFCNIFNFLSLCFRMHRCFFVLACTSLCYPRSSSSGGLFSGSGPKLPQPSEQKGWAACSGIAFGEPKAGHGTCSNQCIVGSAQFDQRFKTDCEADSPGPSAKS